jgi:hypothetical protein
LIGTIAPNRHDFVVVGSLELSMHISLHHIGQRRPAIAGLGVLLATHVAVVGVVAVAGAVPGHAQQPTPGGWQTGIDKTFSLTPSPPPAMPQIPAGQGQVRLKALLTDDGQAIDQGLLWRIFADKTAEKTLVASTPDPTGDSRARLVATHREGSPQVRLPVGEYIVNVGFGRASLTRRLTVKAGDNPPEKFVLNAGGLRLIAYVGKSEAPAPNTVAYDIYSDERDQFGNRTKVLAAAKPALIIRLNSGIYHLVSTYGDANAKVELDVTVEPGKLTEATIAHAAGKATFKLVQRSGGDAVTDTHWSIATPQGETVKESVGALPTHTLIPGAYVVTAKQGGKAFRREFKVMHGGITQVEVMRQ